MISIIALIIGVGAAVALRVTSEARREQTRSMMKGLLSANEEFKAIRKGGSLDDSGKLLNGDEVSSTEAFVATCRSIKTCEEIMMSALNSSTSQALERTLKDMDGNGYDSIYDRWGTELEYRFNNNENDQNGAGPENENGDTVDNDLLPLSRDPFFASAGPDKTWGTDDDITTLD